MLKTDPVRPKEATRPGTHPSTQERVNRGKKRHPISSLRSLLGHLQGILKVNLCHAFDMSDICAVRAVIKVMDMKMVEDDDEDDDNVGW